MLFQRKLLNQTWKNGEKPSFGPNFGSNLSPKNIFKKFYFYYMLEINARYHCMQFQEKLKNQTWENGKKTSFGPDFGQFGQPIFQKSGSVSH